MAKIVNRTRTEVIKRWVTALKSGKYKQAQKQLRTNAGFCCLGVLCDLARKDGGDDWTPSSLQGYEYKKNCGVLQDDMERFIFGDNTYTLSHTLVEMNDNGATFKEIAKVIEEKLL